MESYEDELLTRSERLRAQRQAQHNAPARIGLRLPAIVLVVLGLLCWLGVSWFARDRHRTCRRSQRSVMSAKSPGLLNSPRGPTASPRLRMPRNQELRLFTLPVRSGTHRWWNSTPEPGSLTP